MTSQGFDNEFKLVSSYLLSPISLASIRLFLAFFTLTVSIFTLIWESVVDHTGGSYFSYFTNLTYIGLCAYFFASGIQTYFYARRGINNEYPLQGWRFALQWLHNLLLTTVITFPFLVTIVFWVLLASNSSFKSPFSSFSTITKHALNSAFALFEVLLTNVGPMPWLHLPITVVILLGYLGVAYITHAAQGIYTYSFLDPRKQGPKLAAYIAGIAIGQIVVFLVVRLVIFIKEKLTNRHGARGQKHQYTSTV